MGWWRQFWIKRAVGLACRKGAPTSIPLSGGRQFQNDFVLVHLGDQPTHYSFFPQRAPQEGLEGLWFASPEAQGLPASIRWDWLPMARFKGDQYWRGYELSSDSPFRFCISVYLGYLRFYRIWDLNAQRRFNRLSMPRRDRTAVLRLILDETYKNARFSVSRVGLVQRLYPSRMVRHPEFEPLLNYYGLILDSLVREEMLTQTETVYSIRPQAITALHHIDQEEVRHTDNVSIQRRIAGLTLALVLLGLAQIAAGIWADLYSGGGS